MAAPTKAATCVSDHKRSNIQSNITSFNPNLAEEWPPPILATVNTHEIRETSRMSRWKRRDPLTIERSNLLGIFKLVVKELIDSSISQGRMLDSDFVPLQQFFIVLEHVLRHALKPKKGILRDKRDFFVVLEQVERYEAEATEITNSVKEMTNIKTTLGRARAWLRLAMMQKKLADYFKILIDRREELLRDFYEDGGLLMEEESIVISGLLVGLNVIDCNLCIKEEDLDVPMGVIDFSLYMKEQNYDQYEDKNEGSERMAAILDQKNYLEELNRHLNATVSNLQQKLEVVEASNTLMKEDMAIAQNNIIDLQSELHRVTSQKDKLQQLHEKALQVAKTDLDVERETYETSRAGLDHIYNDTKKKLQEETQMRLDVEKELLLQISMKTEIEMAMKLLEKDIHEKQDTVVSLRKQLDDIKEINVEMYNKLQACESSLKYKTEMLLKIEEKSNGMALSIKEMEKRLQQQESDKLAAEETARNLGQQLAEKDLSRAALETDLKIEKDWRITLQKSVEKEKATISNLQADLHRNRDIHKKYAQLQEEQKELQIEYNEQSKALEELGSHLSRSKLKMEDLRESQQAMQEAQWADDALTTNCKLCDKIFSVGRRKHHCRNCGDIFCNECSDNKLPLASSAKSVRVCDSCHQLLLQRYSAK